MITLEDIVAGERLKDEVLRQLVSQGVSLEEKHEGLHSDNMPKVVSFNQRENQLGTLIQYDSEYYKSYIDIPTKATLRAGLATLFGYGIFKYDCSLVPFEGLGEQELSAYARLAVEVWERNVHVDWMKKCGYKLHNGTKDETFFYEILYSLRKAVVNHRRRSSSGEKGDTPHHDFSDINLFRRVLARKGEHPLSKYLVESIYDQATATSRIWFKLRSLPFEERLAKNRDEGYYLDQDNRWKPGFFGPPNSYETKIWQTWLKAHEEFKDYWINKFGKNEELWQPPAPANLLQK